MTLISVSIRLDALAIAVGLATIGGPSVATPLTSHATQGLKDRTTASRMPA